MDCVFCKIVEGEIPTDFVYKGEVAVAFKDIHPKAPIHLLLVPREHVESLREAAGDEMLLGTLLSLADKVAMEVGLAEKGYKVSINVGKEGGQVVPHLHIHILGGKQLEE